MDDTTKQTGKADYLIKESGCGPFQLLLVFFVDFIIKLATVSTMMFMVFGNYNPGWRCVLHTNLTTLYDNSSYFSSNGVFKSRAQSLTGDNYSTTGLKKTYNSASTYSYDDSNKTSQNIYSHGSCKLFKACQNVEFNPETSTIVTEWGLICDQAWVPPFIISIQMAGILFGSLMAGHLGDMFGRKKTLYIALATLGVLSLAGKFATYWQVYAAIRFLLGVMIACLYNLYNILPAEFLSSVWRVRLASIPSWPIGGLLFAVAAMLFKDWQVLHLIIGVYALIACLPAIWVPESLRWLEVKKKSTKFHKVAKTMLAMNKVQISVDSCDKFMLPPNNNLPKQGEKPRVYSVFDIFRKGYRLRSVIIACLWFTGASCYYAISFGVKAMYGDFYINLIILFTADIPYSIVPMYAPNLFGRKKAIMLFSSISAASLLVATGLGVWAPQNIREMGSLVLGLVAKANVIGLNACSLVVNAEMYPTIIRSNALGYGNFWARVGSILAPLMIPADGENIHISYGVLGALCLLSCLISVKLPETKDAALPETFDEDEVTISKRHVSDFEDEKKNMV